MPLLVGFGTSSADVNVTVLTGYNADGNVWSITTKNYVTADQVTQYVYGTALADSDLASSNHHFLLWLRHLGSRRNGNRGHPPKDCELSHSCLRDVSHVPVFVV